MEMYPGVKLEIKTKTQLTFDYTNLLRHYKKFDNLERQEAYKEKLSN